MAQFTKHTSTHSRDTLYVHHKTKPSLWQQAGQCCTSVRSSGKLLTESSENKFSLRGVETVKEFALVQEWIACRAMRVSLIHLHHYGALFHSLTSLPFMAKTIDSWECLPAYLTPTATQTCNNLVDLNSFHWSNMAIFRLATFTSSVQFPAQLAFLLQLHQV